MAARTHLAWLCATALAFAFAASPAHAVSDTERVALYGEFRSQFDARKYPEALPLAERLVALTEEQYGAEDLALTKPLANLATVHYKLGNFPAAIENYQRCLRILQAKSTIADKDQIGPLHGLGVSFLGAKNPDSAVVALKRAADLSRNNNGLFNIGQVEFIDALVEAYAATGRFVEADKESVYAMRVEEAAYGRSSIKLLGRLDKLARWYEFDRRFTTERAIYERALNILAKAAPPNDLRRVAPLRGIGRAYRLEAFYGVEGGDSGASFNAASNGAPVFNEGAQQRRGESALTAALAVVDASSPADQLLRGEVLADLGDWYLVAGSPRRAYDAYAEAWKALQQVDATRVLEAPRVLAYRPSISSVDRSQLDPAEAILKTVELHFRVDRDGRVDNVTSPTTDVPETIVKNSILSMRRTRYAPRIENGLAVPTEDVTYLEQVLVKVPLEGSSSEKAPATPATPAPAEAKPAEAPPAELPPPESR